jgi:hypothetical protein
MSCQHEGTRSGHGSRRDSLAISDSAIVCVLRASPLVMDRRDEELLARQPIPNDVGKSNDSHLSI